MAEKPNLKPMLERLKTVEMGLVRIIGRIAAVESDLDLQEGLRKEMQGAIRDTNERATEDRQIEIADVGQLSSRLDKLEERVNVDTDTLQKRIAELYNKVTDIRVEEYLAKIHPNFKPEAPGGQYNSFNDNYKYYSKKQLDAEYKKGFDMGYIAGLKDGEIKVTKNYITRRDGEPAIANAHDAGYTKGYNKAMKECGSWNEGYDEGLKDGEMKLKNKISELIK